MDETENMVEEVINLATIMRPFLLKKRPPVVMTTLCMLTAEVVMNLRFTSTKAEVLDAVDRGVRDYFEKLEREAK
jgi:hypothetical protein